MLGHVSVFIALDEEAEDTWCIRWRDRCVRTDDGLPLGILEGLWIGCLYEEAGCDGDKRCIFVGQLEDEARK